MKTPNVTISSVCLAAVLLAFFFLPLPVLRVRQVGFVQVDPTISRTYRWKSPALKSSRVKEGQWVKKDQRLAIFYSLELESELQKSLAEQAIEKSNIKLYDSDLANVREQIANGQSTTGTAQIGGEPGTR